MLFLVQPHSLKWADVPAKPVLDIARENPSADLAGLEWRADEAFTLSSDDVRIALRYGVPCSTGLVVDAIVLLDARQPDQLRVMAIESEETRRAVRDSATADLLERMFPGHREHSEKLDDQVAGSMRGAIERAQEDARRLFEKPVNPQLLEHWESLGGLTPANP